MLVHGQELSQTHTWLLRPQKHHLEGFRWVTEEGHLKSGSWSCRFSQMVRIWAIPYKGPFCSKGSCSHQQHRADCSLLGNICGEYLKCAPLESVPTCMLRMPLASHCLLYKICFKTKISNWLLYFFLTRQPSFAGKGFHLRGCLYPPAAPIPEKSKAALSSSGTKMNKNIMRLSMFND